MNQSAKHMHILIEENTGINLHDLRLGNDLLDMTPSTQATKEKNK